MNRRATTASALAALLLGTACVQAQTPGQGPMPGQAQTSGMVSVELTQVSTSLAERLKVDEARIPMSVQVPPEVAAQVCGVAPGEPSPHKAPRGDGCMARQSTPELDRLLTARIKADDPATMGGPPAAPSRAVPSR